MKRPVDLGEADPRSYVRLAARIRKQILRGDLVPGHPVPSITTLSQELGHARHTCGKAMQVLEQEGCWPAYQGSATTLLTIHYTARHAGHRVTEIGLEPLSHGHGHRHHDAGQAPNVRILTIQSL
jgi:DNA-binding GntR family transcriptional regulator